MTAFFLIHPGGHVTMQPYKAGNKNQQWTIQGRLIVNQHFPKQCLDVKGASNADGAPIIVWKDHGQSNQQWYVDYV